MLKSSRGRFFEKACSHGNTNYHVISSLLDTEIWLSLRAASFWFSHFQKEAARRPGSGNSGYVSHFYTAS